MSRKQEIKKTALRLLCCMGCGALLLLAAFMIGYRSTLTNGLWLPMSMNSDEVIYNRQLAAVLKHGGPQGYFGYNESHAEIGKYSTWGPLVIWLYALPGVLFGVGYNTVFWCNLVFALLAWTVFTYWMDGKRRLVFAAVLLCLWMPLRQIFTGTSEPLHFLLLAVVLAGSQAVAEGKKGGMAAALTACILETVIRPYGVVLFLFPVVFGWNNHHRRRLSTVTAVLAVASTGASMWAMNMLAAPYSEQSLDFTIFKKLGKGNVPGAAVYFFEKLFDACVALWKDFLSPTLHGSTEQYIADAAHGFLRVVLLMAVVLLFCICDAVCKRPIRSKVCGLVCTSIIFLAVLVLYAPLQLRRYAAFLSLMLLMSIVMEDMLTILVSFPLLVLLIYPGGFAHTEGLPAFNAAMDGQMQQVTQALMKSQMQLSEESGPWDHTLTFAYGDVFYGYLYAVPAGMGIEFDWNTYVADAANPIQSRYTMVNHGTEAEARLLADGWKVLVTTENQIIYECP